MGRRSSHKPDELRALILSSTRGIIEQDGLVGLSAREIARKIDYSAGTLYNVFENLDDLLLTIQIQMLDDAVRALNDEPKDTAPRAYLEKLTNRYIAFALQHRKLWNLLFQHHLPNGKAVPAALHDKINEIIAIVTRALKPLLPNASAAQADQSARVLWAAVHGISAIAVTDKSPTMTSETAQWYAAKLLAAMLDGMSVI